MRGIGTKKMKNGSVEIHGFFDHNSVNGKGYKKWKKFMTKKNSLGGGSRMGTRQVEFYIYRGNLKDSQIDGKGEFKWPDGRHYIGDFANSAMHGNGKLLWIDHNGQKAIYRGELQANQFHGQGKLTWSNGDIYQGSFENGQYSG